RPLLDFRKYVSQPGKTRVRCVEVRVLEPLGMADGLRQIRKSLDLCDHVNVGVRIGFPAFAFDDPAGVATAGGIAGAWYGVAKCSVGILGILFERTVGKALLIT